MATSRGFEAFARRMARRGRLIEQRSGEVVQRAALIADQIVVTSTPVDTGRARANWITSIGSPVFTEIKSFSSGGASSQAIAQGQQVITTWRVGRGPIFISNSVPYIEPLDRGWSGQAPNGMTAEAIRAASSYLRRGAAAHLLKE